jgi:dolichyl-phosphate-mannose--protein O-mannosyl transferase
LIWICVALQITYGSTLKLMHDKTKVRLHSHDVAYGSGSGQQSVTGFPQTDDSNSYWVRLHPILNGRISWISSGLS